MLVGLALLLLAGLPVGEMVVRALGGTGIPGSGPLTQHVVLWVAFLGAALAAREKKLLGLATGELLPDTGWGRLGRAFAATATAAVTALLADASWKLTLIERDAETTFGAGWPSWVAFLVIPFALALIAARVAWFAGPTWRQRVPAFLGLALGLWLSRHEEVLDGASPWPGLFLLAASTLLGGPLFAVIGGSAALLFLVDGTTAMAIPAETIRMAVSPHLAALPLFTLTGFLLAEGDVAERLLRLFRALFGWMPGGTAVVCATLCAFLTVFTGGSGVTILVLGGLLFQALQADGYREKFSLGLLTASGSLGLLLPPALPLILYGIVAEVPIEDLFLGGVFPGLLLVALIAAWGVREGVKRGARRTPFRAGEVGRALWAAKLEVLLPLVALLGIFGGFATLVETSAVTALYALGVQVLVHRNLSLRRDLLRVVRECSLLVGGVLLILGVAMGFTSWVVDAEIPARLVEWAQANVESRLVFLLALNVFLLIVGCMMDIFSATVVVVPLIVPLGAVYGIDPVHLGIIFIANLELGYLTPPVGLNLFLASYRFERPLITIYRAAVPMLVILGIGVLLITYLPFLTTGIFGLLPGRPG